MRAIGALAALAALAGCASRQPTPSLALPTPQAGEIAVVAEAAEPVGGVQPIAVSITNGRSDSVSLDPRQISAERGADARRAPLTPAEAARLAGGRMMHGSAVNTARQVGVGSVLGAASGAIWGAITGGSVGLATGAGAAVGAFGGVVSSIFGGGPQPDVAGFQDRALPNSTLAPSFSATGFVYYPAGEYRTLELLFTDASGQVERVAVPVAAAAPSG